jgi:hypothetical protein
MRIWSNIFHVAGRAFVEGAYTPVISPETISVRFAIPTEITKQMKRMLEI